MSMVRAMICIGSQPISLHNNKNTSFNVKAESLEKQEEVFYQNLQYLSQQAGLCKNKLVESDILKGGA
jgi:hypothetical protein